MAELCTIATPDLGLGLLPAELLRGLNCLFGPRGVLDGNLEGFEGVDEARPPEGFQPMDSKRGCIAYLPASTIRYNGEPDICPLTVLPFSSLFLQIRHFSLRCLGSWGVPPSV